MSTHKPFYDTVPYNKILDSTLLIDGSQKCIDYMYIEQSELSFLLCNLYILFKYISVV